jgi:hypothetical protein
MAKSLWIKQAIKKPGALTKTLGASPTTGTIPKKKLAAAAKKPGVTGQRARLAQTLASFTKKKSKKFKSYF